MNLTEKKHRYKELISGYRGEGQDRGRGLRGINYYV